MAIETQLKLSFEFHVERVASNIFENNLYEVRSSSDGKRIRPRFIICRLTDWKQNNAILKAARKEKPSGFFINKVLATETLEKRKLSIVEIQAG